MNSKKLMLCFIVVIISFACLFMINFDLLLDIHERFDETKINSDVDFLMRSDLVSQGAVDDFISRVNMTTGCEANSQKIGNSQYIDMLKINDEFVFRENDIRIIASAPILSWLKMDKVKFPTRQLRKFVFQKKGYQSRSQFGFELTMKSMNLSFEDAQLISKIKGINRLFLMNVSVGKNGIVELSKTINLESMDIYKTDFSSEELLKFEISKKMKSITIEGPDITPLTCKKLVDRNQNLKVIIWVNTEKYLVTKNGINLVSHIWQ